jgi:hypothetical protein
MTSIMDQDKEIPTVVQKNKADTRVSELFVGHGFQVEDSIKVSESPLREFHLFLHAHMHISRLQNSTVSINPWDEGRWLGLDKNIFTYACLHVCM